MRLMCLHVWCVCAPDVSMCLVHSCMCYVFAWSQCTWGDLNIFHKHPRLRTRRTIHERETGANQSQTSQTVHEAFTDIKSGSRTAHPQGLRPSKHRLSHSEVLLCFNLAACSVVLYFSGIQDTSWIYIKVLNKFPRHPEAHLLNRRCTYRYVG